MEELQEPSTPEGCLLSQAGLVLRTLVIEKLILGMEMRYI